jgi:hypothetical protein
MPVTRSRVLGRVANKTSVKRVPGTKLPPVNSPLIRQPVRGTTTAATDR